MSCPRCKHAHCVKNGKVEGKQRYKCPSCGLKFTRLTPRGSTLWLRALAVFLYSHGLSMNAIAKMFSVSPTTILRWIRKFGIQHAHPPEPKTDTAVVLELDEMWHYLKKQKLWIWKALCRDTGELIAWECGHRDQATLKKLLSKLSKWQVKLYWTDDWHPYKAVIPPNLLVQSKKETHRIERNNNNLMRHWFGRFKRKSIIVSKSKQMVDLTIALFARFRVNGSVFDIFDIVTELS